MMAATRTARPSPLFPTFSEERSKLQIFSEQSISMFHFSFRQYILLGVGLLLILLAVSLNRITELWDATVNDHTVAWHRLAISPGKNAYVSSLDESMLVLRSSSHSDARLTLFTREDDGSTPEDLVRDLCGRDSCEFSPLEDARLDGAIADYASGVPLRFVLMHPAGSGVWLEYKGPPDGLSAFDELINAIVIQLQATADSNGAG